MQSAYELLKSKELFFATFINLDRLMPRFNISDCEIIWNYLVGLGPHEAVEQERRRRI